MHKISKVVIRNFRSCDHVEINLADFTPLVGYNNAGKSNIVRALEWAVEVRALTISDFFDPKQPIEVECHVTGITEEVLSGLGTHRSRVEPHVVEGKIRIRTIQVIPGGAARDVNREIWLPEVKNWGNPQGIPNAIKALFPEVIRIEAMIDVNAELSSNKTTTTIGKLIKAIMDPIITEQGERIRQVLSELTALFGAEGAARAKSLTSFDAMATEALQEFFPGVRARLDAPAPDIKEIFKTGKLVFAEESGGEEVWREVQYYGHGVLRAAQMAMIKMLAKVVGAGGTGRVLLLIDEPELYMHPQMIATIRESLRNLASRGYQVVFSTHSPIMIGRSDITDTVMVSKNAKCTSIRKTLRVCCNDIAGCDSQVNSLMLDLNNSSQFLFCDNVVLFEGATEKELLPELMESISGTSLLRNGTAIVALNGCSGLQKTRQVLEALGISHRAIVDLDFAFKHGPRLNIWSQDDTLYKKCLTVFKRLSDEEGYPLDTRGGLFCNGQSVTAESGYNAFALSADGTSLLEELLALFKYNNIWLWPRGSIEYHLGMPSKGGEAIRAFREKLVSEGYPKSILDFDGVSKAVRWVLGRD